MNNEQPKYALWVALSPVVFLMAMLSLNVYFFKDDTLSGSNQIALLMSAAVVSIIAHYKKVSWKTIKRGILKSIDTAMPAMLILLLIGSLAGTWMISGVIPTLVYYGLNILEPKIFLFATVVITSVVSISTGSSWSTVATIGVALMGIGIALGINEGIVAGAIISGAYFGDKMSPLSDTTNLAPAMAGTDLFTHIRYMVITTVPSIGLTLIVFLIMGWTMDYSQAQANITIVQTAILEQFVVTPWLLLVPVLLLAVIILKVPPLPSLMFGTLLGGIFAIVFQPHLITSIGHYVDFWENAYVVFMQAMFGTIEIQTSSSAISELFHSTGMHGMLNTIWLIISAMVFGGALEASGMLKRITDAIISKIRSTFSLVGSTVGTCIFFNLTTSDQYISIVVPGRMYADIYREKGFKPELLSRTLEDSGTVTSVLIPWNTCGATQSTVLGVSVWAYAPYAFFNWISPLMSLAIVAINYKIRKFTDKSTNND
ncbi:MAG: Na+/H+ antiporter NhaC [Bacteroidales bacterium]|nr:Na+/H+ antiporter NhaC [Bacteroidales bacterium]